MPHYEPTELPPNDADFGATLAKVTAELLVLTSDFFNNCSPATRGELRQFLADRGWQPANAAADAFLDRLQFTAEQHSRAAPPATT